MSNAKITADITQKRTITAEMVARGGGGGTCDYNDLNNKPMINGITLYGNKTAEALNLADFEHTHTQTDITDFPTLATVATTNNYQDLDGKLQAGAGILIEDNVISATGGGGTTSDIAWLPNVSTDGDLSWQRSEIVTPPETVNIKGADGRDGAKGEKGIDGLDGKSAYEIAIENGFIGTESEWLASLKGENGLNGIDGLTVSVNGVEQVDGNITLTASEIPVENENFVATDIDGALDELFTSVSNGKTIIADAITDKGVETSATDTFAVMADKIGEIEGGGGEQLGIYPIGTDGRPTGDVVVPSGVTSLYRYLFDGNKNVITVQLPYGLISVSDYAFHQCSNLSSITIPNSVTSINNYAFYQCSNLSSITIPNSVTSINNYAFYQCSNLSSITIPNSVTSIGGSAFQQCSSLSSIILPDSVTSIEVNAFYGCTNLASVDIKTLICTFVSTTFRNCTALTDFITYPNFNPTTLNLSDATSLSVTSMVNMGNNLVDLTGQTAKTITFGANNLAKLTTEQKQVFIDKNWVLA